MTRLAPSARSGPPTPIDFGVIVVGASAGGVDALSVMMSGLPADLPAAVLVVLHVSPTSKSVLPRILSTRGPLPAHHTVDGEALRPGRIYVAPPDHHMELNGCTVRLTDGPRENWLRPSLDTLFRSAATQFGPKVIGVVLSGTLDDGTAGLIAIKRCGGVAIVQDPVEARFSSMPASAARFAAPDHIASLVNIPALLTTILGSARTAKATALPRDGVGENV